MALVIPNVFVPNTLADANAVNANFTAVANYVNQGVVSLAATIDLSALSIFQLGAFNVFAANPAATNTTGLTSAITQLTTAGGGTIFCPYGNYNINTSFNFPDKTSVVGSGPGTQFIAATSGDLFTVQNAGNGKGVTFANLAFAYAGALTPTHATIYVIDAQDVRVQDCWFNACPAVYFDNNTLQCGITDCTIDYFSGPDNFSLMTFYGSQGFANNIVARQKSNSAAGGPSGVTCCTIGSVSTGFIGESHFSVTDYGLLMLHGWVQFLMTNVRINSEINCILFKPDSSAQSNTFKATSCVTLQNNTATQTTPMIFVDTNGFPNSALEDVQFIGHTCYFTNGHGMQINAGTNIKVTGGMFSACGLAGGAFANIAVTGGVNVDISGVNMTGTFVGINNAPNGNALTASPHAFIFNVGNSGTTVCKVTNCDMTGSSTSAVLVSGTAPTTGTAKLLISGCKGYNDLNTPVVVANSLPTSPATAASYNFYGPTRYTVGPSVTSVTINGVSTTASTGDSYVLGPYDAVNSTGSTNGNWIGIMT